MAKRKEFDSERLTIHVWVCMIVTWGVAFAVLRPDSRNDLILSIALGPLAAAVYGFLVVPIFHDGKWVDDREGRYGDPGDRVWVPRADLERSEARRRRHNAEPAERIGSSRKLR